MGYDKPRSLGGSAQAALYTAPIFRDFMKMALKDTPITAPFRIHTFRIKLISVDVHSGMRATGSRSTETIQAVHSDSPTAMVAEAVGQIVDIVARRTVGWVGNRQSCESQVFSLHEAVGAPIRSVAPPVAVGK